MKTSLAKHDEVLRDRIEKSSGHIVKSTGDGLYAVFGSAHDAVAGSAQAQAAIAASDFEVGELAVRMGIHTGEAEQRGGDYFGNALNKCARLMAAGHGRQILLSSTTVDVVRDDPPPGVLIEELGKFRLKDLERPETIYQLNQEGLPSEFDSLRTLEAVPNNIPIQLTSFVGREQDLAEALKLLGGARLLTLTGVGGSGKTRLAMQIAGEVLDDYEDGVWLVELAPVTDPDLLVQEAAEVFDVKEEAGRSLDESLIHSIGQRQLLLVLDNCEHMISPVAHFTLHMLERCPSIKLVATSREMLGVPGETAMSVQSLQVPAPGDDRDTVARYDSVRLFTERASAAKHGFRVTKENAEAVGQICRRLDGIPLALELAAARLKIMTPAQIAERLDDRFQLLTGGSRTAVPRQRTLEAAVDWSYELLDEHEQLLFQRLSVFTGGFTLEAAEEVCGDQPLEGFEVLDLLGRLVDKSLIVATEEIGGAVRNRMLETLRQYAASKLADSGVGSELRRRHSQFFLDLVRSQRDDIGASHEVMQILLRDQDNIRAALRASIDADDLQMAAAIVSELWIFWYLRGLNREGREWTQEILKLEPELGDEELAGLLHAAGSLAHWGDETARTLLEQELQLRRALADPESLAKVLNNLSIVEGMTGHFEKEKEYLQESVELEPESSRAIPLSNLGWNAIRRDQLDEAVDYLNRSLEHPGSGDERGWSLAGLAFISWLRGESEKALALATDAIAEADEVGSLATAAVYKVTQAQALISLERTKKAQAVLTESRDTLLETHQEEFYEFWLVTAAYGQADPAARVRTMAAARGCLDRTGLSSDTVIGRLMRVALDEARIALGKAEFEKAWHEGYQQTFEEASDRALQTYG